MIIKIFEITRIVSASVGCFITYYLYDTPEGILHLLAPWMIVTLAGLSGIEGLFFGKKAAEAAGYETGSKYQIQTAFFFIALSAVALFVYFANWGVQAELTLLFVFLLSMLLSSINHAYQAIVNKDYKWKNLIRPFLTIFLIAIFIYPIIKLV